MQTESGAYGNGSYAFGTYVFQQTDGSSYTGQQTSSLAETLSASGTTTLAGSASASDVVIGPPGGGQSFTLVTATSKGSNNATTVFAGTITAAETVTATESGVFNESLYRYGSYGQGSYAFSSTSYQASGSDSATSQAQDSRTAVDSYTATDTQSSSHTGANAADAYSLSINRAFAHQDNSTASATATEQHQDSYALAEAGGFSGGSYALSSFSLLVQNTTTTTLSTLGTAAAAETGSYNGLLVYGLGNVYNVVGTYTGGGTKPTQQQSTWGGSSTLSEQGTFSAGSFSLSSFVLAEQQTATSSTTASGSATQTFSGTDSVSGVSGPYSGTQTWGAGSQETSSSSSSLVEQGRYANGTFSLTTVTYTGSGADSASATDSSTAGWGGSYAGNASSSDQATGTSSYVVSAVGSFLAGSWSLSSYVLRGSAAGTAAAAAGQSQSFNGQHASTSGNESAVESDSLYQAGTESGGTYSNSSYSYTDSGAGSATSTGQLPNSPASSDTWTQQHSSQVGLSLQTNTAAATYTVQDSQGSGTYKNGGSASGGVTLPGALAQLPVPDGSLVPVAGADAQAKARAGGAGSLVPVPLLLNAQALADTGAWMGSVAHLAEQAVAQAVSLAGVGGQWDWTVNGLPAPRCDVGTLFGMTLGSAEDMESGAGQPTNPGAGVGWISLPFAVVSGADTGASDGDTPQLPQPGSYAAQVWNGLGPLFHLLGNWAGRPALLAQGQLQALLGVRVAHQTTDRPPTTGDPLVDWVDGMLYDTGGQLTVGSARLYGAGDVGISAGDALAEGLGYVVIGADIAVQVGAGVLAGIALQPVGQMVGELAGELLGQLGAALGRQGGLLADLAEVSGLGTSEGGGAVVGAVDRAAGDVLGAQDGAAVAAADGGAAEGTAAEGGMAAGDVGTAVPEEKAAGELLAKDGQDLQKECIDGQCLGAGVPLRTRDGEKPVEAFRAGDRILSRDQRRLDGPVEEKVVEAVFVRQARLLHVHVGGQVIRTTAEHPFWVYNRGWQTAAELRPGDALLGDDGERTPVEEVYDTGGTETVYNLRVADYHTYFVGARAWGFSAWAHNAEYPAGEGANPGSEAPAEGDGSEDGFRDPRNPDQRTFWDLSPEEGAPKKTRWDYRQEWHDQKATEVFGEGNGRSNIGGRDYDKYYKGRDIEFKADNFENGPRSPDELKRMSGQIDKDIANLGNGEANPHWHFYNDPQVAPEMGPLLDKLDAGGIPWTWGRTPPF